MRNLWIVSLLFLFSLNTNASAATYEYDTVLDDLISQQGIFDGDNGILYSDIIAFSDTKSLMTVSFSNNIFTFSVYDNADGMQCTDVLDIPIGTKDSFTAAIVDNGEYNALMFTINTKTGFYNITNDAFTRIYDINYTQKNNITSYKNQKITSAMSKRDIYNCVNSLKRQRIDSYSRLNCINTISDTERKNMLLIIKSCADIMDYDFRSYDYDTLMQYILSSGRNFQIVINGEPEYSSDNKDISITSASYIDKILEDIFEITPTHPPTNSLIEHGFCVDNGYYYYHNIFNVYFSTDVIDIDAVYNLDNDKYYIVFTDLYRQGTNTFPEYSYAILNKKADNKYTMLKLGMGSPLLSENELSEFTDCSSREPIWKNHVDKINDNNGILICLWSIISISIVTVICGIIFIFRYIG